MPNVVPVHGGSLLCADKEGVYALEADENGVAWEIVVTADLDDAFREGYHLDVLGHAWPSEMAEPVYTNLWHDSLYSDLNDCADGDDALNGYLDSALDDDDWQGQAVDDGWAMTGDWQATLTEDGWVRGSYAMELVSEAETINYSGDFEAPWDRSIQAWINED